MKHIAFFLAICASLIQQVSAADTTALNKDMLQLQQQANELQKQLQALQLKIDRQKAAPAAQLSAPTTTSKVTPVEQNTAPPTNIQNTDLQFHTSSVSVHSLDVDPESLEFYPTALVVDDRVLTYIAGTPVVSSPYLGSRPAFDGSDYMVNVSSINRDIRLMQQRRGLERAYKKIGYPVPNKPIIALSGKAEPIGTMGQPYVGESKFDWNLGSDELDVAAILNSKVEAYMALAYDASRSASRGPRVNNSSLDVSMGFVNIGDLDASPIYLTAGQLFAPFGRFSSSMVSAPLTLRLARIKTRPIILGYKSQNDTGPYLALYAYRGEVTEGNSGVTGFNIGYILDVHDATADVGISAVSSLDDSGGMQMTGSTPGLNTGTFGGFSSLLNGNEDVYKVSGLDLHASINYDRYNVTAEWVGALTSFRDQDLSFNGVGAQPQALQLEAGFTFIAFDKPSSLAAGYQWSGNTLALNLPENRICGVFNISIWKDTVESLEYRHDIDFGKNQYANGAAPIGYVNANTLGTGSAADTLLAQIGVYF